MLRKNISKKNESSYLAEKRNKLSNDNVSKKRLQKKALKRNILRNRAIAFLIIVICIITLSLLPKNGGKLISYDDIGILNLRNDVVNFHNIVGGNNNLIDLNKQAIKDENHIDVPYINQSDEFPNGCEIASATMLLNYYKYNFTMADLVDKFVPITKIDVDDDGNMVADSPYNSFVGDPRNGDSYGCFAPVIVKTLKAATNNEKKVVDLTGMDLDKICNLFISNDIPVLIWCTINMVPSYLSDTWKLLDGSGDFTWIAQEHCVVLVGYDADYYYFNDPYEDNGKISYDKDLSNERYIELGRQAVAIIPAGYKY
ncbi:MAG: C39 family peptidase [Oscillospiraceae bacterium]|nr:C39 family peptidase [Oscillospiraceae bacterium]